MSKVKFAGSRPKITLEQYAELKRIKTLRATLPTYSDLAKKWGFTHATLLNIAHRGIKRYDYEINQRAE